MIVFFVCDFNCRPVLLCNGQVIMENSVCVFVCVIVYQVRNGRTGSVLFQSEEKPSRIRCTCLCRQPSAVALGQEDGTVQVNIFYDQSINLYAYFPAIISNLLSNKTKKNVKITLNNKRGMKYCHVLFKK